MCRKGGKVPEGVGGRVVVEAREVPLYLVLQAITRQAGLEYRAADGVVSLKPQPALDVNVGRLRQSGPLVAALRRPVDLQLRAVSMLQLRPDDYVPPGAQTLVLLCRLPSTYSGITLPSLLRATSPHR